METSQLMVPPRFAASLLGAAGYAKDTVEDALNHAVCAGQITLRAAQPKIGRNWITATLGITARPRARQRRAGQRGAPRRRPMTPSSATGACAFTPLLGTVGTAEEGSAFEMLASWIDLAGEHGGGTAAGVVVEEIPCVSCSLELARRSCYECRADFGRHVQ